MPNIQMTTLPQPEHRPLLRETLGTVLRGLRGESGRTLRDVADAIGDFGADVRDAMSERELELRAGTGLDAPLPAAGDASLRRGAHSADS